ncbi:Methylated-DNA--protein-cysteine methyltransferase, constitutive [Thiorhodovibrio winogradskyi]|uniref:Methylated-DNA--protein-cysteine methyltransferase, constitutive n=1 Tax=Thiorhodovibrio winogradskyi TaxID=77007 RepID=A0ABZ0S8M3_9GAMM|nr:methylated-DNA--[protein]-cysteine S-methyltransferase [Thiorhodovibrio winogradskyi]
MAAKLPMTSNTNCSMISAPFGALAVDWRDGVVSRVRLPLDKALPPAQAVPAPAWLEQEFQAYFRAATHEFSLAVRPEGTAFQQRVWQALRRIPAGRVSRYGDLAAELGSSARAVGNACRANPCPLLLPCHRVVARRGLGGFAGQTEGATMRIKTWLLRHEGLELTELGA